MKNIYYYSLLLILLVTTTINSQEIDATLLELKFSNDGYPEKFTKVDNGFFFSSQDDQLWFSNETKENTFLVKDFNSGTYDDITSLTPVGTKVFFVAENGNDNRELWVSDGTEVGTIQLTDRNISSSTEDIYNIIEYNEKIYFGAYSEAFGNEIWVSDGTSEGTFVLKDIATGIDKSSNPHDFFVFNEKLFFKAYTEEFGTELWVSDGTYDGTVILKDIKMGSSSGSTSEGYIIFNQNFYFFADNGTTGNELWKSDGTSEGTFLIKDIHAGYLSSIYSDFKCSILNNKLIFTANNGVNGYELWESDGTSEGTQLFKDINTGDDSGVVEILNSVGNKIFFKASNGIDQTGLWVTDGTSQNTFFLNDATPNFLSGDSSGTFAIYYDSNGLWKTDGTINGTYILSEEIEVTSISVSTQSFLAYENKIFFNGKNEVNGNELWVTDGTKNGTKLFYDVDSSYGVNPSLLTTVGNKLFFRGNKYGTFGLCTSDGTIEGTKYLNIGSNEAGIDDESEFIDFNGKLVVSANDGIHGYELWISDGTQEGTHIIKDINVGYGSSINNSDVYTSLEVSNDKLYFHADDGNGLGLWITDGTNEGTYELTKSGVNALIGANGSTFFTTLGEDVYFFGTSNGANGLFKIDSITGENTFIQSFVQIEHMYVANNKLFIIQDSGSSRQLWVIDELAQTPIFISNFADDRIDHFSVFGNNFYFNARAYGSANKALYKSNGTIEGTIPVFTNNNLPITTYPLQNSLISTGEYLYFGLLDSYYGTRMNQLWRTDGTAEETIALYVEEEGEYNPIENMTSYNNDLLFTQFAYPGKLSKTNGELNEIVNYDFNIINSSSNIGYLYNLTANTNKLFFSSRTGLSGNEIFVTLLDSNTLSIEDNISNNFDNSKVIVYPNPSSQGIINISGTKLINEIEIYDLSGKKIITKSNKNLIQNVPIKVDFLSPGIYIVKVVLTSKDVFTTKIIIE